MNSAGLNVTIAAHLDPFCSYKQSCRAYRTGLRRSCNGYVYVNSRRTEPDRNCFGTRCTRRDDLLQTHENLKLYIPVRDVGNRRDRLWFSIQGNNARHHNWHHNGNCVGGCYACAFNPSPEGHLEFDLCVHGYGCSLPERLCFNRTTIYESPVP